MVPEDRKQRVSAVGARTIAASGTLAGGFGVETSLCLGMIDEIENYVPPAPIEILLTFLGKGQQCLLGRKLLDLWIAEFDGPRAVLRVSD